MDAIIFAAGRGERLRPLTDMLPKPLIEVSGCQLIEAHLYQLARLGFSRVIINVHHLGDIIQNRLEDGSRYGINIIYSVETKGALETAGGIVNALHLIESNQFIAISADIICDYRLDSLLNQTDALAHLVLVNNPAHHSQGDFSITETGDITLCEPKIADCYTFSGIARLDKKLFRNLDAKKLALRSVLTKAIHNRQVKGELHQGLWSDIGTMERLAQARQSKKVYEYINSIKQSTKTCRTL